VNARLVRLFGYFGILAPIVGFLIIYLSIRTAPWFSWTGNALSDLGVEGFTAVLFNDGLTMTAAVMIAFSMGLYELTKEDRVGRIGFRFYFAACLFLLGIGFFPETAGDIHTYFSVAFFVVLPLSLLFFALYMFRNGMRNLGVLSAVLGAVAALVWAPSWGAKAIPEALSALAAGVWSVVLGAWMTRMEMDEEQLTIY
jgi:hypothetical membrane protein